MIYGDPLDHLSFHLIFSSLGGGCVIVVGGCDE